MADSFRTAPRKTSSNVTFLCVNCSLMSFSIRRSRSCLSWALLHLRRRIRLSNFSSWKPASRVDSKTVRSRSSRTAITTLTDLTRWNALIVSTRARISLYRMRSSTQDSSSLSMTM
jgi:hypothetical protein